MRIKSQILMSGIVQTIIGFSEIGGKQHFKFWNGTRVVLRIYCENTTQKCLGLSKNKFKTHTKANKLLKYFKNLKLL